MGVNYRCQNSKCRKRFTLKKPFRQYARTPKCPACGSLNYTETTYDKKYDAKRTCHCDGLPWPHRKGTILNAYYTCRHAETQAIEDADFNEGLGVNYTIRDSEKCPF